MKTKLNHTVGTVTKYNTKIVETGAKSISLTHKYMTSYFPDLVQALQCKVVGFN